MRCSGIFQSLPAVPLVGRARRKLVLGIKMPVNELKVGIVAYIAIIFCAIGSVSTKDDQLATARHSYRGRFAIQSVSSGGNGLVESERDVVVKESRWRNNRSDFILDIHKGEKERDDAGLSSSGGIRTAEVAGGNAVGSSGKSAIGSESRGVTKSTLLQAITQRHCDFDDPKTCYENQRTTEELAIDDVSGSAPFIAENKGRQRREAKVNRKVTDERIHFPDSSTGSRLNTRKKNQPNSSAATGVGVNQSGNAEGEMGEDGVDTYFLSKAPTNCPSGQQLLKGRCRAVRE